MDVCPRFSALCCTV